MKMRNFWLLGFTGLFLGLQWVAAQVPSSSQKVVQVVLLGGQSNMVGQGDYDKLDNSVKERIEKVKSRVMMSVDGKDPEPLSYYTITPNEKYNFTKKFGPELLMGLTLAEAQPDKEFLLIKRAQGGTSLYGAWNPDWSADKAKAVEKGELKQNIKLYEELIKQIHQNLARLKAEGKKYEIIGMAWMQGENDAAKEVSAASYEENLKKLIAGIRKEFALPKMPFVIGQINSRYGSFKDGPQTVRQAMEDVAAADEHVAVIKTTTDTSWSDFPKHSDNVHYNHEGQRRLGIAFANELTRLRSK